MCSTATLVVACLVNFTGSFQKSQYVSRNLVLIIIRERLSMSIYSLLESVNFGHLGKLLTLFTGKGNFVIPKLGSLWRHLKSNQLINIP